MISRLFGGSKNRSSRESKVMGKNEGSMSSHGKPQLNRALALKNVDYVLPSPSGSDSELRSRSLDSALQDGSKLSFRVRGVEGEFQQFCESLGLAGAEDFGIPADIWEATATKRGRSLSDTVLISRSSVDGEIPSGEKNSSSFPKSPLGQEIRVKVGNEELKNRKENADLRPSPSPRVENQGRKNGVNGTVSLLSPPRKLNGGGNGINGIRPAALSPLPSSLLPVTDRTTYPLELRPPPQMKLPGMDRMTSTWEFIRSFSPEEGNRIEIAESTNPDDGEGVDVEELVEGVVQGDEEEDGVVDRAESGRELSGSGSFTTSVDDDSSSSTTDSVLMISPNGKFRRQIKSWSKGDMLGSGSFGTVYEGISDDGFFFAVKEVSMLGNNAQQCISQLEHEIELLSQFEHENIVQYLGTDKEVDKLYIFLELVTQKSLASLYQRFHLQDSQVSVYTRQILNGLKYLHERDVMHRDIKCANILVDASGVVKLADFGLAKEVSKSNVLKSCKGSAYWMAPEVVNPRKSYGLSADIWSLGCTVLEMLTRQVPYSNMDWIAALFKIGRGEPPSLPASLSRDARNFIEQCIIVDPEKRPTAAQLLNHPFVKKRSSHVGGNGTQIHDRRVLTT